MRSILLVLLVFSIMVSCNESLVLSEFKTTEGGSWAKDAVMEFRFSEIDSVQKYNLFINVRNDENYPYNNLFLIAELDYPGGETVTDTLEYEMALPDGSWLGKGFGSIKENKLWYKENIVFRSLGVYTLRLTHAMRKNGSVEGVVNLEGITDVGFEIEKNNK